MFWNVSHNAFVRSARLNWKIFDINIFSFRLIWLFRSSRGVARGMAIRVRRPQGKIISSGDSAIKMSEIRKRTSKKYQDAVLWSWLTFFSAHLTDVNFKPSKRKSETDTDIFSAQHAKDHRKRFCCAALEAEPLKCTTTTPVLFICTLLPSITSC